MDIFILYFLIGLCASILGAVAGLGGGVIIKPVLDTLGHYDVATIGILSSATVFSMAAISLINAVKLKVKIEGKTSFLLAIGSIIGGVIGKNMFNYLMNVTSQKEVISLIQSGILALLMILIFVLITNKEKMNTYHVKSIFVIFIVGLGLGVISSFLGIGGGPLNVAILYMLFSMDAKNTVINSIFIIFFSQLATLVTVGATTGFEAYDLSMLIYMIPGAVIGGFLGTTFSSKLTNDKMVTIFNVAIACIFLINVYNVVRWVV